LKLFFFIFAVFLINLSASAEHVKILLDDYPNCSLIGAGGNKQTWMRTNSVKSKWGRDNVTETFMVKGKKKNVVLRSKIRVANMIELKDGKLGIPLKYPSDCASILERSFHYKKELLYKAYSVVDYVDFKSQKNFGKKRPEIDYTYPSLELFIYYDSLGKYKPESMYAQLSPQNENVVMINFQIALNHYDNLDFIKMCNSEKCVWAMGVTKYKTKEKYLVKSGASEFIITDPELIPLIENKIEVIKKSIDEPLRVLFTKKQLNLFMNKVRQSDVNIRVQTNH